MNKFKIGDLVKLSLKKDNTLDSEKWNIAFKNVVMKVVPDKRNIRTVNIFCEIISGNADCGEDGKYGVGEKCWWEPDNLILLKNTVKYKDLL